MFRTYFKYSFLCTIRNKQNCFWNLLFPILLGTLFFGAFSNISETELLKEAIPIAITGEQTEGYHIFLEFLKESNINDKTKMFAVQEADAEVLT